ncbi:MAG TPA: ThuA domain-containing protein, partial [Longimicrobiaceae bacterium]
MRSLTSQPAASALLLALVMGVGAAGCSPPPPVSGVSPSEQQRSAARQSEGRRIEVLFLGNDATLHRSDSAATFLVPALAREGINFQYTTDPNDLNRENLALYDALIVYGNHDAITPAQERALLEFVEAGNGYVPIHSASASFINSPRVVALTGGEFDRHGRGTFTVPITQPEHPVMEGVEPFETWDET